MALDRLRPIDVYKLATSGALPWAGKPVEHTNGSQKAWHLSRINQRRRATRAGTDRPFGAVKGRPVKSLPEGLTKSGGRNNTGRITSRRRGGGAKRLYRIVDFKRNKFDVVATVERIEYDPNRTAFIALVKYEDGEQAYIPAASVWQSVIK